MDSHIRLFGRWRSVLADQERALRATALAESSRRAAPEIRALYTAPHAVSAPSRPGAALAASVTPAAPAVVRVRGAG
jgi:hypothetical protein